MPVKIPVSKITQPIGEFYVGRIPARTLIEISYTEIRSFLDGTQDKIAGIQRERSERRINEIKKYVNLDYATFPTSVIISVPYDCVELQKYGSDETESLYVLDLAPYGAIGDEDYVPVEKIAFIIDGQHRVAGLEGLEEGRQERRELPLPCCEPR